MHPQGRGASPERFFAVAQNDAIVGAAVEKRELFLGESLLFQIQLDGSDQRAKVDLAPITDFEVQPLAGRKNNSQSVSVIGDLMTRHVRRGYLADFRLKPKRAGDLSVPADGQTFRTRPITIRVHKPSETDYLKLRLAPAALTFRDVEPPLRRHGVPDETLGELRGLFERCEAGRCAGGTVEDPAALVERAGTLARSLERCLK